MGAFASVFQRPAEEPLLPAAGILDFEGRNGALFAKVQGGAGEVQFAIKGCNWVRSAECLAPCASITRS
jgi:hypothetical protein